MLKNIKIEPTGAKSYKVYADGEEIEECGMVEFLLKPNRYPQVTIELSSLPEFDGTANVTYDFTPWTFKSVLELMDDYLDPFNYRVGDCDEFAKLLSAFAQYTSDEATARKELKNLGRAIEDILSEEL